ncbi:hypothetical protein PLICRDRAFT_165479 [Plicaturopsis crispa FD-325 SS-3]|nr:hypothetical protein PLICRDRAFT_165479 [Plicaturopsis crispa FD-325 SS-3]
MSKRGVSSNYALPPNPVYLDFPRSDGSAEHADAVNTNPVVDENGEVNFYREVGLDESANIKWRHIIGAAVALELHKPEGPNYVLRGWPEGYKFFDHNKGKQSAPRHDIYLIGSASVNRFRSCPEFIPHAQWLMEDPTMDRANCKCKYCSKTPQRRITAEMGLKSTPTSSPGPSRTVGRVPRERKSTAHQVKPYASVRRKPKPARQASAPKAAMLRERDADLRAVYSRTSMQLNRIFRESELIWCQLSDPILGETPEEKIDFWPGLVQEIKLKSEPVFKQSQNGAPIDPSAVEPPAWTVNQSTIYKVKLLAVDFIFDIFDHEVLPYQAHSPPSSVLTAIANIPVTELDTRLERTSQFNPCPPPENGVNLNLSGRRFKEAAAPYALAVQIASSVAGFWCPTDDWEYKFVTAPDPRPAPPPPAPVPTPALPASTSLHAVIAASMLNNAALNAAVPSSSQHQPPPLPQPRTQTQFQGLWWGAERIWTGELIRLKVGRRQIAPEGNDSILPPSGPSKSVIEYNEAQWAAHGLPPPSADEAGAATRGVFMMLDGVFTVEIPKESGHGTRKECRACGMLYELADADWEGPMEDNSGQGTAAETGGPSTPSQSISTANGDAAGPSGHSPHKPGPLRNPDPTVSVSSTVADTVDDNVPVRKRSANDQLSHPIDTVTCKLPVPPRGYKFRPILKPDHEAVVALTLISGRYYPGLLEHPLLAPIVHAAVMSDEHSQENEILYALDGIAPGFFNTVDPTKWKPSRQAMVRDADSDGKTTLLAMWARKTEEQRAYKMEELQQDVDASFEGQAMEVDS